jgi:hypothetical protein
MAAPAICADEIPVDNPRPLSELVVQLVSRYGYLVNCQEALVDPDRETFVDVYPDGRRFSYPVSKPVTFHVARGESNSFEKLIHSA